MNGLNLDAGVGERQGVKVHDTKVFLTGRHFCPSCGDFVTDSILILRVVRKLVKKPG
jgi:hypothetical protein